MVVNLDILIAENVLVNFFLLYITSQTLKFKLPIRRYILPALIGGVYVITMIYPSLKQLTSLPFKICIAFLMTFIFFRKKDFIFNIKALLIYILYSMLVAGLCFFIVINNGLSSYSSYLRLDFSYKKLILSVMLIYIVLHRLVIFIRDRNEVNSLIFNVDIKYKDIEKSVRAFLDTGNELREPVTNLPVMIIENYILDEFNISEKEMLYIPYKVVNGQGGKLTGFKPEYIKIHRKDYVEVREVIIALCNDKLSSLDEFNALLSRGII